MPVGGNHQMPGAEIDGNKQTAAHSALEVISSGAAQGRHASCVPSATVRSSSSAILLPPIVGFVCHPAAAFCGGHAGEQLDHRTPANALSMKCENLLILLSVRVCWSRHHRKTCSFYMTNTDTAHPEHKTRERERIFMSSLPLLLSLSRCRYFYILILREVLFCIWYVSLISIYYMFLSNVF